MLRRSMCLLVALTFFAVACSSQPMNEHASVASAPREADGGTTDLGESAARADSAEAGGGEEDAVTAERMDALAASRSAGTFANSTQAAVDDPAPGWVGERVVNPNVDDWEPAVATDPYAPYIYILTTRYGTGATCQAHCPTPYITLTISSDNGKTWGRQRPIWGVKG